MTDTTAQARTLLAQTRADILAAVAAAHPEAGCLPMPTLPIVTSLDKVEIDLLAEAIFDNLGDGESYSDLWYSALTTCPHLPQRRQQVRALVEALNTWMLMLDDARAIAEGKPGAWEEAQRSRHTLNDELTIFRQDSLT